MPPTVSLFWPPPRPILGRIGVDSTVSRIEQALCLPRTHRPTLHRGGVCPPTEAAKLDFKSSLNAPPPCLTGFLPPKDLDHPRRHHVARTAPRLYCKVASEDSAVIARCAHYPCMDPCSGTTFSFSATRIFTSCRKTPFAVTRHPIRDAEGLTGRITTTTARAKYPPPTIPNQFNVRRRWIRISPPWCVASRRTPGPGPSPPLRFPLPFTAERQLGPSGRRLGSVLISLRISRAALYCSSRPTAPLPAPRLRMRRASRSAAACQRTSTATYVIKTSSSSPPP